MLEQKPQLPLHGYIRSERNADNLHRFAVNRPHIGQIAFPGGTEHIVRCQRGVLELQGRAYLTAQITILKVPISRDDRPACHRLAGRFTGGEGPSADDGVIRTVLKGELQGLLGQGHEIRRGSKTQPSEAGGRRSDRGRDDSSIEFQHNRSRVHRRAGILDRDFDVGSSLDFGCIQSRQSLTDERSVGHCRGQVAIDFEAALSGRVID